VHPGIQNKIFPSHPGIVVSFLVSKMMMRYMIFVLVMSGLAAQEVAPPQPASGGSKPSADPAPPTEPSEPVEPTEASTEGPTTDTDATPNHSPTGEPGANLPVIDTDDVEIKDCNLTHGYYVSTLHFIFFFFFFFFFLFFSFYFSSCASLFFVGFKPS